MLTESSDFVQFSARETILLRQITGFTLLMFHFWGRFWKFRLCRRQLPRSGIRGTIGPGTRRRQRSAHQFRRQRLGARQRGAGADDDGARPDSVLRRAGTQQERPLHDDAQPDSHGGGVHDVDGVRLQHGVQRRQRDFRQPVQTFVSPRRRGGAGPGLRGNDSSSDVHAVPDDVRHHHAGVDQRRGRGAHQIQGVSPIHRAVDNGGLSAALPHDVGQRRVVQLGARRENPRARLRRRHGGAHQFRGVGARVRACAGQTRRLPA